MKKVLSILLLVALFGCTSEKEDVTQYVDPLIGTDGHGHTFPGATMPFGMVQLSPDTRKDSWDGCSGYHFTDSTIMGFSHTHLSGTGVGDYGDVRIMPMTGGLKLTPGEESNPETGYRSRFSHEDEVASPGYYKAKLLDYNIQAELTATQRCGFHQYTFLDDDTAHVIIDLAEGVTSDIILELSVEILSDHEITGLRRTRGWANDQYIYFYAEFSEPFSTSGIASDGIISHDLSNATSRNLQVFASYYDRDWDVLQVKVGISAVSREGARNNVKDEVPGWNFNEVLKGARAAWDEELSKINVSSGEKEDKIKFYTALYHACVAPNVFSDHDGSYRGHDGGIHQADNKDIYTVFSLWDTYRALHPLMTIMQPERTNGFIQSMLDIYKTGGLLPVWELAGNETFCMIGYHAVPVIVDAAMKGYTGFDRELALEAIKHSATQDHFGLASYRKNGYIPADEEGESVSKTLEYAYDDWCIAQMASLLQDQDAYEEYLKRAQYYKNLFDPETGFIRGKRNGAFVSPFDPAEVNFMLTEANTWQYTFYVPQDLRGMMELMGGADAFAKKLDELFSTSSDLKGRQQADITGLIGQYAHGNEPSHHAAYLYNFAGQPYKTQKIVRQIMHELYGAGPAGLCGNEDCGQMSAWFVMSSLGFYPVTPGNNQYIIGSPLFAEVDIKLQGQKRFTIRAKNNSPENIYIQSAILNGEPLLRSYLYHKEVMEGGELEFVMGPRPSAWATAAGDLPVTAITEHLITPVPFFQAAGKTFRDEMSVSVSHIDTTASLFFTASESANPENFKEYAGPIQRTASFNIAAYATSEKNSPSMISRASYKRMHNDWSVMLKSAYSSQYTGGGDLGLVDGETGGINFRTGGWQGYEGVDFEVVIDMGKKTTLSRVNARFLEDQGSWIFLPREVEIGISDKPYDFKVIRLVENPVTEAEGPSIREFGKEGLNATARYIKVRAVNAGECPAWHIGAGGKTWLFIDEIEIE